MEESSEILDDFAALLQRRPSEQPPNVYKDVNLSNRREINPLRAGDIISNVAKQIKKLQVGANKMSTLNTKTLVKTPLVPVNMLAEAIMPPVKPQETDQTEEAACYGVTQEFDTTFDQQLSSDLQNHNDEYSKHTPFHIIDISLKEPDPNKILDIPIQKDINPKFESQFENCTQILNECIEIENIDKLDGLFVEEPDSIKEIVMQINKTDSEKEEFTQRSKIESEKEEFTQQIKIDPNKELFTENSEIDPNKEVLTQGSEKGTKKEVFTQSSQINPGKEVLTQDSQKRSPSPVFSVKSTKTKTKPASPLVFNLDSFEKFEGIATSLVDEDTDLDTGKQLINSQIFGKELYLQKDEAPFLERDYSPIIELNTNGLKIDRKMIPEITTNNNKHSNNTDKTDNNVGDKQIIDNEAITNTNVESNYLEDEILFSSDEEDERSSKSFKDLPFTCALETSFYEEESQVLDKNMFVSFQTANNKSILVKTGSFSKAKNLLDDVDESLEKTASVTELVELQSKSITDKDTNGNSLSNNDVKIVRKADKQSIKITTNNGDTNSINEPKHECLSNSDNKETLPENTPSSQSILVSGKLPDFDLKKVSEESATLSNSINNDKNNSEQEEIHKLDEDILLEFQDEMTHKELNSEPLDKEVSNKKIEFIRIGFKTASNKNIAISDVALTKSKKMLQDIDLELRDTALLDNPKKNNLNANLNLITFKTASNKNIKISNKALSKIKSVFHDIDLGTLPEEISISEDIKDTKVNPGHCGFKTASNKDIVVSEKAVSEAKTIFQDLEKQVCEHKVVSDTDNDEGFTRDGINNENPTISDECTSDSDTEPPFFGFEHNKDEKLALQEVFDRSQKIFEKLGECGNVRITAQTTNETLPSLLGKHEKYSNNEYSSEEISGNGVFEGFKTASNKKVIISEKALERSRKLFQDIHKETSLESEQKDTSNIHDRGKKRTQEQQQLNEPPTKRQKLTHDHNNMDKDNEGSDVKRKELFSVIETASNKPIEGSEKVKTMSENLLKNNNKEKSLTDVMAIQEFKGFQTANNRPITVSENALKKSKKLFQDIDIEKFDEAKISKTEVPRFIGAENDNNKKVAEKDLVKSLKLSQEIHEEMFKEPFLEDSEKVPFIGFHTATNKPVTLSKKSLEENLKLLQSFEADGESKPKNIEVPIFKGFQTASNKKVNISEKALERSRKMFQDFDSENFTEMDLRKLKQVSDFAGFKTASNKEVKLSETALEKSRNIFQDIDGFAENAERKKYAVPEFKGFQTASNKMVKISEKALEESKKMFQDFDHFAESDQSKINSAPKFTGFQTASRKQVKVSEKALERSRKLFGDLDHFAKSDERKIDGVPTFTGFQTASKKEVKISEEAFEKSRKLFQVLDGLAESDQRKIDDAAKFTGFKTASKKEVKISEKALERSRKLFGDLDGFSDKIDDAPMKFTGFQTASKKEVQISERALEQSKKLFQDIDDQIFTESKQKFDYKDNIRGFHTANNKDVKVSEKALERTRKMFQNLTESESELPSTNTSKIDDAKLKFGFTTANNNQITLSKESLLKSKALFENFEKAETITSENESKDKQPITEESFEINTKVLNDFEMTFKEVTPKNKDITPVKSKRSGSPILSCPKAKKRKIFKIPYSQKAEQKECIDKPKFKPPDKNTAESQNTFKFSSEYKKSKSYTLKDLQNLETESIIEKNIDTYIQNFNFNNILSIEFSGERNEINNSTITIKDLKILFQNSVNQKLIPDKWLDIQLKLIIWKLISYELKFPKVMKLTCTARNVMEQLKFRYDKELYNAERPILRKIMEKDDVSSRTMILCVVSISNEGDSSTPVLTLTDGWYTIKAVIDKMLSKYVGNGKIQVGTKLVTHGAELVGAEQAVSPWEDTSSICLKLFGNSTRRARWDARLGCYGNAAILSHLSNVTVEGGKVPKLRVLVTRVYPPLYVDKFDDGSTVTRSERLEHLHQMKYESERQAVLDKIYEEVEREVDQDSDDSEESASCSNTKKKKDAESEMAKIMKRATDTQILSQFTSTQKDRLEEYNEKWREKIMAAIQSKVQDKMAAYGMNVNRNVVTVLKVRVADIEDRRDSVKVTKAMLSIWRPNEAITEVIKENAWIEVLNVTPTAFRYSELQLSAGRQSIFSHSKHKVSERVKTYTQTLKRTCYPIKNLVKNPTMSTDYNEIDTIGIVFQTHPSTKDFETSKQLFQTVYLADIDKNIISINFWGGLKKFGFENCLDTGQIVAGINLQKRAGNTRKSIPQYRVTEFTYFTKTPKHDDARKMIAELSSDLSKIERKDFLEECIRIKDNYSKTVQINENVSPYRFPNIDMNSSKTKMFLDTPLAHRRNEKDDNFHLTGLDFESSFKQDTEDVSPKMLLRKQQLERKMAKLKMYGEPPALSPIQIINKSKSAGKAYKSPLISNSDVSLSVANKEKNLPNQQNTLMQEDSEKIDCSPVICFNRTYVKNCDVKPVKLNFSKNDDSCTDDFVEEFDHSRL